MKRQKSHKSLQSKQTLSKMVPRISTDITLATDPTAPGLKHNIIYRHTLLCWAVPRGESRQDLKGKSSNALIKAGLQCLKNRIQYVLFDTEDMLPQPPLLCQGSLGFMVGDYSRPQKQLLKSLIKADSCSDWEERPVVGARNVQICLKTKTEV